MNNDTSLQTNTIKNNVLEKIRTGEIRMTSKRYFTLKVLFLGLVLLLVLIISSFLVSYILFSINESRELALFGFGAKGILVFFLLFPWSIFALDIALIIILEWLFRKFKFGYRSPLMYLVAGTVIIVIAIGYLLTFTPFHRALMTRSEHNNVPVIGGYYNHLRRPTQDSGVFKGTIISINNNIFMIQDDGDSDDNATNTPTLMIVAPPGTAISSILMVGDHVFVAGTLQNGQVHAYGVTKVPKDD